MHQEFDRCNSTNHPNNFNGRERFPILESMHCPYLHFHQDNRNISSSPSLDIRILDRAEHL